MAKHSKKLALCALCLVAVPAMSACGADEGGSVTIKALNCEDYIGEDAFEFTYTIEDENGLEVEKTVTYDDVISGFEQYESMKLGKKVHVIYDCYDTNETMLSSLQTGKTTYDLIAASDYAIQKMMSMDMLQKIDLTRVPNYTTYGSSYLLGVMDSITADINGTQEKMSDYSVGYMWGTLGILFNPAKVARDKKMSEDEVKFDMQNWSSLWDKKYKNEMSVKDSMRDTYSVGIMERYGEEILTAMEESGCFDMEDGMYSLNDGMYDLANGEYHDKLTEIFNRCDEKSVQEVRKTLLDLKENVFGFEVDSGKDDMVKGLVGMNLAWSGDAVYAMDRGENEANNTIYYSIPKTGGNIWFDSWCLPKRKDLEKKPEQAKLQKEVSEDFLDFLSNPEVAAANMETIGYTSFIAGETVHSLIRLWYDPRSYAMFVYHDASLETNWEDNDYVYGPQYVQAEDASGKPLFDDEGEPIYVQETDEDGNPLFDENGEPIYQRVEGDYEYDEELGIAYQSGFDLENDDVAEFDFESGILNMAGSTYEEAVIDGVPTPWGEYMDVYNAKAELVNELIVAYNETVPEKDQLDELEFVEEWDVRDLTYMFDGTIDPGDDLSILPEENRLLFYTDELEAVAQGDQEVLVGRQFYAQYPDHNMIPKLAVMRDYGANNIYVLKMWSDVKSNNLPIAGVVVFGIILAAAAAGIIAYIATKKHYHAFRVARRKEIARQAAKSKTKE